MRFLTALPLLVILGVMTVTGACDREAPPAEEPRVESFDAASPCLLTEDMVGDRVRAAGEVAFVDNTEEDGVYIDLEADGCRVGVWAAWERLAAWNVAGEDYFIIGAQISVEGKLTLVPMPARPTDKQLVIEMDSPPQLLGMVPPTLQESGEEYELEELDMPAYTFDERDLWQGVTLSGTITYVENTKAAGLYGELEIDGRKARLWVERKWWDTWSEQEQGNFRVGNYVTVDGILTLVLNEPVVDLSVPPVLEGPDDY